METNEGTSRFSDIMFTEVRVARNILMKPVKLLFVSTLSERCT